MATRSIRGIKLLTIPSSAARHTMTKGKKVFVEGHYGWLDVPYSSKANMSAITCCYCDEMFTFFNGRKSCDFCGATVHSKCLKSVRTALRRAKMCLKCYQYKHEYSNMLMQGDEFICYSGQLPAASYLHLSEEHGSLTIMVDPLDNEVEIPLSDIVYVQKGFSHAGHMRAGDQYNPIKCFSLTVLRDEKHYNYDLKAYSAHHCQQWVTGLNLALHVYKLVTQTSQLSSSLEDIDRPIMKKRSLIPAILTTKTSTREVQQDDKEWYNESTLVISTSDYCVSTDDIVVVDVSSSRETTPTLEVNNDMRGDSSPVVHTSHYKIRTIPSPYHALVSSTHQSPQPFRRDLSCTLSDWSVRTIDSTHSQKRSNMTVGLPYKGIKNPMATYCGCHAYAIEPPTGMLFPPASLRKVDPFSSCCVLCRDKCRMARDLSNI